MFWKREEKIIHGSLGPIFIPPPPSRKQFATMIEMVRDAEKYYNIGEMDISRAILLNLCEFIEKYKAELSLQKAEDETHPSR